MPAVMPVYIHTINIGNWKLVGLSREAVTQYGIEIRRLWPDQPVSVVGYTNDVSSYFTRSFTYKRPILMRVTTHSSGTPSLVYFPKIFWSGSYALLNRTIAKRRHT